MEENEKGDIMAKKDFRKKLKVFLEHHPNAVLFTAGTGLVGLSGAIPTSSLPISTIEEALMTGASMGLLGGGISGQLMAGVDHINKWFDKKFGKKIKDVI